VVATDLQQLGPERDRPTRAVARDGPRSTGRTPHVDHEVTNAALDDDIPGSDLVGHDEHCSTPSDQGDAPSTSEPDEPHRLVIIVGPPT
jgi:hypothetical protein